MDIQELKSTTVFVIDDNVNNLSVIRDHLLQNGLNPIPLKSGEEALQLIKKMKPDIILLDVQMPGGIDGFETCRQFKSTPLSSDIPVIFISALSESVNKVEGFNAGGVDYVLKPIDGEELLSRIYVHITISRLQRKLGEVNQELEHRVQVRTSELERTKDYLAGVIDSMDSVIIGIDAESNVTLWNQAAVKISGLSPEQASGKIIVDVFPSLQSEIDLINESLSIGQMRYKHRKLFDSTKHLIYEDIFVYPLASGGAVLRIDNVSEKIHIQEILVQNEKMTSLGGLAAGMAHEINNPLAGIIQTAKVMHNRLYNLTNSKKNQAAAQESGVTVEQISSFMDKRGISRMLDTIISSGKRLTEIVNNMLSFVYKGRSELGQFSMTDILDECINLAGLDYDMKKHYDFRLVTIKKSYSENLPFIECEKAKIQQVILNMLHNAAQAMHYSQIENPCIKLKVWYEQDIDMLAVDIEDNGPGIEDHILQRIFEPFFTTKPEGVGTGLGLSVSYYIVTEDHGGQLTVDSVPAKGTIFHIKLPRMHREATDE